MSAIIELNRLSTDVLKKLCRTLGLPNMVSREQLIANINGQIYDDPRLNNNNGTIRHTTTRRKRLRRQQQQQQLLLLNNSFSSSKSNDYMSLKSRKRKRSNVLVCEIAAARAIQRWWRRLKTKLIFVNDSDFVTLESLERLEHPFWLVEDTQHVYRFHPLSLAQWFLQEGKFINPFTRSPLNIIEIKRLDRAVQQLDASFVCLAAEHTRITAEQRRRREHEQTCRMLHEECINLLQDIMDISDGRHDLDVIMFQLASVYLPRYFHTFRQLHALDHEFACDSIMYVCAALERMKHDVTVTNTQLRSVAVELTQYMLVKFCCQFMPIFALLLNDRLDRVEEDVPTR